MSGQPDLESKTQVGVETALEQHDPRTPARKDRERIAKESRKPRLAGSSWVESQL